MSKKNHHHPPKWADRLLSWLCKDEVIEHVQGDLHEIYSTEITKKGKQKANLWFIKSVLGLIRPRLIKKLEGNYRLNGYGLFKSHLKTSVRSIRRNALFSSINVVGLAISMSVGMLLITLLIELYSYDDFHKDGDDIYRVTSEFTDEDGLNRYASTSYFIGDQLQKQVPQIDVITTVQAIWRGLDLKAGESQFFCSDIYAATGSFFNVFSFEVLKGDPHGALAKPNTVVLTESLARKLFKNKEPVGEIIEMGSGKDVIAVMVTAVLKDPPLHSHFRFEALVSMKTMEEKFGERSNKYMYAPQNIWSNYVYAVIRDKESLPQIESSMESIMADFNERTEHHVLTHRFQQLQDIVLSEGYSNEIGPTYGKKVVQMMIFLAVVVVIMACFNYTNLSLARGLRRSREVGIRKVQGASRYQIFVQFILESSVIAVISLFIGFGLFQLLRDGFISLPNESAEGFRMITMGMSLKVILAFIFFALLVGVMAGFLPALVMSKIKELHLFVDVNKTRLFSRTSLRDVIVTIQFAMSIGMIMFAFIVFRQYQFAVNYDLGFTTDNIMHVDVYDEYAEVVQAEFATISGVVGTAKSAQILGVGQSWGMEAVSEDKQDSIDFYVNYVDENYLSLHQFEIVAGAGFTTLVGAAKSPREIVVNRQFVEEMNLGSDRDAVGKKVWYQGKKFSIVGVVEDLVNSSIIHEDPVVPFGFFQTNRMNQFRYLAVNYDGSNLQRTIEGMEQAYRRVDPIHPFQVQYYEDRINETYQSYKTTYTVVSFLSILAISISAMGMLGMLVFTIEARLKEISVRKILGANLKHLLMLFSKPFMVVVGIAAVFSIPFTLMVIEKYVFSDFAYHIEIGISEILSGVLVVLVICSITILWQVRTAANQNPADLLRDE